LTAIPRLFNTSVRAVLALSVVMLSLTLIAATAILYDLRQREVMHAKGEIVSLSRILAEQTTRTFEGVTLMMFGARERLSDNIGRSLELNSYPVRLLLQARIAGLPQIKSMFVVDAQGFNMNSSRTDFIPGLSLAQRQFFRYFADGGRDEVFISTPEKARIDGQWTYYVSVRLADVDGQFRGVLVASISMAYFESLYDSIGLDLGSRIQLLNRNGLLMAGKPHQEELFGKLAGDVSSLHALEKAREGLVIGKESLAGSPWYVAYRQVSKYPLVISVAVDEDEALAQWQRVLEQIIAGITLLLLFVSATTVIVIRTLTRKTALEIALKERDEQLRNMVQSVRDAIVTVNSAKHIVFFNQAAERIFGIPAEKAIGQAVDRVFVDYLPQVQNAHLLRYLEEGLNAGPGLALLGVLELQRDQQPFPVELSLSTSTFRGEVLLTAVFRDLTERQRAEHELLEKNRQLQELSASLQNVREEERTRIARELHDELGQFLTGIRMEISWLGGRLPQDLAPLKEKVSAIKGQIDQTIQSVRRISSELRPLVLDDLGFAAAANWYVDQFIARTGLVVDLALPPEDPEQGSAQATAMFRVLQESLTNIARHAQATQVEVCLELLDGQWTMSIRDDGVGFAVDAVKPGSLGLVGMRERVQILGGQFIVNSAPGKGTAIELFVPATPRGKEP
jgi:PAS domain S-box-containing protein